MSLQFEAWPKFTIDYKAIAQGIYDMTGELGDNYVGALSLGMLPAPLMDMLDKQIADKAKCTLCELYDCPKTDENKAMFILPKGKVEEIVRQVTLEVLHIASANGLLVV